MRAIDDDFMIHRDFAFGSHASRRSAQIRLRESMHKVETYLIFNLPKTQSPLQILPIGNRHIWCGISCHANDTSPTYVFLYL